MRKVIIHILGLLKVKTIDNILFETEIKKKTFLKHLKDVTLPLYTNSFSLFFHSK